MEINEQNEKNEGVIFYNSLNLMERSLICDSILKKNKEAAAKYKKAYDKAMKGKINNNVLSTVSEIQLKIVSEYL